MTTTCLLCTLDLNGEGDTVRPYGDGFAHIDCAESHLFVYGTLRVGGALDEWLPERLYREPATVSGFALHYAAGHRGYPYLIETGDPADIVHGELVSILADDDEAVLCAVSVTQMEVNAGYDARAVVATLKDGSTVRADAFVWPYEQMGERIASGDWTLTPEWQPWTPPRPERPSAPVQAVADERAVVYCVRDDHPFNLRLIGVDGTPLWEGVSFSAMGRWAKERNLRVEHAPAEESAESA